MFDVGFFELAIVGTVALLVLGPERLPHAARMLGAAVGKLRRTLIGFKADLEHEIELEELNKRLGTREDGEGHPLQQLQDLRHELESIQEQCEADDSTDESCDEDNEPLNR